ncbi:hypothetical protein [Mesorhizobium sp. NZP2077]|uniref:hypothetical protein n=1 Tax=Mesorhizobium sp. NZP2077 TaxID=2483404 RepID=UPI001552687E|nr:hypothetical protein [Mesorhizobium sp. NZP2077]QKD13602.1 hypothetical protein HGP13_30615 [Mesorhizobium sp. NZP2077]
MLLTVVAGAGHRLLVLFAFLLTLIPSDYAGRAYAAYYLAGNKGFAIFAGWLSIPIVGQAKLIIAALFRIILPTYGPTIANRKTAIASQPGRPQVRVTPPCSV